MTLFQRIKTPFGESTDEGSGEPQRRAHAVGELLRARRQELELDLGSIGEALCIKPVFLAALEQGRAEDLPGPAYAIGFVRAYAHYLGLDGDRVIERYKAESADVHARPDLALPVPLGARSLPGGPILLVGLILALCGYGTWYYLSTGDRSRPERVAAVPAELQPPTLAATANPATASPTSPAFAAPRLSPLLAPGLVSGLVPSEASPAPALPAIGAPPADATPAAALLPTNPAANPPANPPAPAGATAAGPRAAAGGGSVAAVGQVDIRALADCWIQVSAADQSVVFSRVLKTGETYRVPRSGLFLRTGNAGALAIAVDGKPTPALGAVGALRRNVPLEPDSLLAGTAIRG